MVTREGTGTREDPRPICLLAQHFPPVVGGSAVLFGELYSRLTDRAVRVLTQRLDDLAPEIYREVVEVHRRDLEAADWGILARGALRHHWRVSRFLEAVANRDPVVVHCGRTLPEGLAARLLRLRGGPPFLCWAHGDDLTMQLESSREYRFLTHAVVRAATGFLANSKNTARLLLEAGAHPSRIRVVHPGVDDSRFRPEIDGSPIRRRHAAEGPLILSVGRLEARKGFDLTLQAVARLKRSFPDLRYLIVGEGRDRPRLEDRIRDLGIAQTVEMVGEVSDAELPLYYAACDVFCHPNRVEDSVIEGFGIVFLEAAATGIPAIGGRSGGVPEAVLDGETGLLADDDVDELTEVLQLLLSRPELRRRLGGAARRRVTREFSWQRSAETLTRALDELTPPDLPDPKR